MKGSDGIVALARNWGSLLFVWLLVFPYPASAQTTATLEGLVTDPDGGVVAGAHVTLSNALTRFE